MRLQKHSAMTGKAGEYAVAAQLLLRKISILWPSVDSGCDLMTDNFCRIQVKTAHLYTGGGRGPRYSYPLPKNRRVPNSDNTARLIVRRPFSEICDFVVFWGVEQNRFWIVPAHLCDSCTGVELGIEPKIGPRFVGSVKDMREMLSLGYSRYKVAQHYGMTQTSLGQFLDSGRDTIDETIVSQMRACEGRWENIIDFVRSAAVVETPTQHQEE